jgi:FkbM family methyltransferase
MPEWISTAIARDMDRPETRAELARQATEAARAAAPGMDIEILWDDMWVRRVGPDYFPDPDMWSTAAPNWERWTQTAEKFRRDVADYWFYVYKPERGDVIVDIGAGRGEDVFVFSKAVGPSGRVWAIEPHPVSFAALKKLCELNRLSNVIAVNCACVDAPADLQIETLPVWESNYVRAGDPSPTSWPVEGVRFDDLRRELGIGDIDFLKMNIEGAERMALPGCRQALDRTRTVCVAAHDFRAKRGEGEHFRTLEFVRRFLTDAGFSLITRDNDPRYYVPYHVHGRRE